MLRVASATAIATAVGHGSSDSAKTATFFGVGVLIRASGSQVGASELV